MRGGFCCNFTAGADVGQTGIHGRAGKPATNATAGTLLCALPESRALPGYGKTSPTSRPQSMAGGEVHRAQGVTRMARRSRRKARYSVDMTVKAWDLAKAGSAIEIAIRERDVLLGTIQIGQGGFRWHPAHGKKGFKRIRWSKLAEDLNERY
jgi:hypothetical protein